MTTDKLSNSIENLKAAIQAINNQITQAQDIDSLYTYFLNVIEYRNQSTKDDVLWVSPMLNSVENIALMLPKFAIAPKSTEELVFSSGQNGSYFLVQDAQTKRQYYCLSWDAERWMIKRSGDNWIHTKLCAIGKFS